MNNCEKCGKTISEEDTYEYKDHLLCEVCAEMLQENDFNQPDVMGCDGPVGTQAAHKD